MLFHSDHPSRFGSHLTGFALRHARTTLLVAAAAAIASLLITAKHLEFRTERADLLSPRSEFHQRWLEYVREFGDPEEVIVVVAGDPVAVRPMMDRLGAELEGQPELYRDVYYRFDSTALRAKGLYYLTREQLIELDRWLARVVPLLQNRSIGFRELLQTTTASTVTTDFPVDASLGAASGVGKRPATALNLETEISSPPLSIAEQLRERWPDYQTLHDGRLGLVTLHLVPRPSGFVRGRDSIQRLRDSLRRIDDSHPDLELGLTGLPVIEYDEMRISQSDMTWASVASFVGVIFLFAAGFGTLREPAWAAACLLLAITWTCGYVTLVVGHLNILSISFGVILIGLGIDFSIHFIARYRAVRQRQTSPQTALQEAGSSVTPAILIGGLTTAVAFFAAAGTEFLGLAELGLIAGAGILLCLLSTLLVLPALISLLSPFESGAPPAPLVRIDRWMAGCWRYPRLTVLMGFAVTLGFSGGLPRAFFDHNLLHLQAKGLESVTWEQRLLEETQRSAWFAISLADSGESLRQKKRQFEQLDAVERVEEIASLVPENVLQRSMIVGRIHDRLASLPSGMPVLTPLTPEQLAAESSQLGLVLPTADGVTPTAEELNVWRTRLVVQLWQSLQPLRQMAETAPPTFADLPAALRARFLGKHGTQLLRVYGRGDIWQRDVLQRFVEQIQRVDPQVTGHPLQAFYASRQMQRSYLKAAGWSAVGVLLMLAVYLRRLDLVLLAVLPTALGMVQLLGLLGWLGIPLNPANLIVLPLIIGIGIDDGVHVIHELRARPRQSSLSAPTAAGIVITSLTSMIGFGTLILARHEGLRSLGRVVTLGIACCLGTSALLLPCLVRLVGREAPPTRER